jgi:hypothetical protein
LKILGLKNKLILPFGERYSIFGIGVDRKYALKWLFSQEKASFCGCQKVYMYSENALGGPHLVTRDLARHS